MRVARTSELARVPHAWLTSDQGGPALIDVCIDRNVVPPMADRVKGLALGPSK